MPENCNNHTSINYSSNRVFHNNRGSNQNNNINNNKNSYQNKHQNLNNTI